MTFKELMNKKDGWIKINSRKAFLKENDKIFAFFPKDFKRFKGIEWFEIYPLPFLWQKNIPKFRFKVGLIKPSQILLKKYLEYLNSIKTKREQMIFHQYPNALLKNWKNSPKLFNRNIKKIINYREDFFAFKIKKNQNDKMQFLEVFSIPIENEIIEYHHKKIKNLFFWSYYDILFSSRQLLITEINESTWENGNIKESKLVANDYKGIKEVRKKNIFNSISIILQENKFENFPCGSFIMKTALQIEINIKLPIGLYHFGRGQLESGIQFSVLPLSQNELLIILSKKLNNDNFDKTIKDIIDFYIYKIILDKRNKFLLIDNETNKNFINFLKNKDRTEIYSPFFQIFYSNKKNF